MEFFRISKTIPFMRHAFILNTISVVTFLVAVFFIFWKGLTFSIEFTGGTQVVVQYPAAVATEQVREDIDRVMLERIAPYGTVLKDVYMELNDGNVTFGRQIGSYPLLVGVPYKLDTEEFHDVFITEWGFRSITGITYPFDINHMPMSSLEGLPGVGKKRATRLVLERPFKDAEDLERVIEDPKIVEILSEIVVFR